MAITNDLLNTSDTIVYTSVNDTAVLTAYFCNHHPSTVTIQINIVENAGVVSIQNQIYKDLEIPAGDTLVIDTERLVLANGDAVVAKADVSAVVSVTIVHVEV